MVVSGYLIKFPYWIVWQIVRLLGKNDQIAFYVDSIHDYYIIENVLPYIDKPFIIVARNKRLTNKLRSKSYKVKFLPAFPKILIMTRHSFHRFPVKAVKKIGMRHGPYHFKKMIDPAKYNMFDLFIFTSEEELKKAENTGITCGVSGGYPKLDALKKENTLKLCNEIKKRDFFDKNKTTLLFTTTWDKSGMSAIDKWVGHLTDIKSEYNVFVSLHPMMSEFYVKKVKSVNGIKLVNYEELPAHMLVSDFLISDTSSVIAEFSAINKPIIVFKVKINGRLTEEICRMIEDISVGIDGFKQLDNAIEQYKHNPDLKRNNREYWNKIFFDNVDISHGQKTADIINKFVYKHLNT